MHNMMVEVCLESDKVESAELYNTLSATETESVNMGGLLSHGDKENNVEMETYQDVLIIKTSMTWLRNDGHLYTTRKIQRS